MIITMYQHGGGTGANASFPLPSPLPVPLSLSLPPQPNPSLPDMRRQRFQFTIRPPPPHPSFLFPQHNPPPCPPKNTHTNPPSPKLYQLREDMARLANGTPLYKPIFFFFLLSFCFSFFCFPLVFSPLFCFFPPYFLQEILPSMIHPTVLTFHTSKKHTSTSLSLSLSLSLVRFARRTSRTFHLTRPDPTPSPPPDPLTLSLGSFSNNFLCDHHKQLPPPAICLAYHIISTSFSAPHLPAPPPSFPVRAKGGCVVLLR